MASGGRSQKILVFLQPLIMLTANEIRQKYLEFFESKNHKIVPSAPIVLKDDPTLMFTNAGMVQFKDYFLGNKQAEFRRVVDTQKCLRVSGKHNDLEEVGVDHYHHTMFEMLGNWSFGDPNQTKVESMPLKDKEKTTCGYFKPEAIAWSWEFLTEVLGIEKDRLYASVFEGDDEDGIPPSDIALKEWQKILPQEQIVFGNKKDNFWEMGETGPCGPCSEIHIDMRSDEERKKVPGRDLVNMDHEEVIEIWNNVFIQYNRKKDRSLEPLPAKHVDTGMGFERLVRAIQGKKSNYDTDVFMPYITKTATLTGRKYKGTQSKEDIAFRVVADHIRTISFTIADGQMPSNTGAGYVVRRILRRAVSYYYSHLGYKKPLLHELLPVLAENFKDVFPEVNEQVDFIKNVILKEEESFLSTISDGLDRLEALGLEAREEFIYNLLKKNVSNVQKEYQLEGLASTPDFYFEFNGNKHLLEVYENEDKNKFITQSWEAVEKKYPEYKLHKIATTNFREDIQSFIKKFKFVQGEKPRLAGETIFQLYDTFGFPYDLTKLIADDLGLEIDEKGFERALKEQKTRSKAATTLDTDDWQILDSETRNKFVGYDNLESKTKVLQYRKVSAKNKKFYQIVLAETPFYAESGGQVGDKGSLHFGNKMLQVFDTKKENDLILHFVKELPDSLEGEVTAHVNETNRKETSEHHSATHLLHAALRKILGTHVAQKGSLVNKDHLRFDFSHLEKVDEEEQRHIEELVNQKIRENIPVVIKTMSKDDAMKTGAMALFGEKYGDEVRVVMMDKDYSIELCGGTHVGNTGELGFFKILSEGAIAAGVRRIEAVTGAKAEKFIHESLDDLSAIKSQLKNPKSITAAVQQLADDKSALQKEIEKLEDKMRWQKVDSLLQRVEGHSGISFIGEKVDANSPDDVKKMCFALKQKMEHPLVVLCGNISGKANVCILIDDAVQKEKSFSAKQWIKEIVAPRIKGGGGGQDNFASAGGQLTDQFDEIISEIKSQLT